MILRSVSSSYQTKGQWPDAGISRQPQWVDSVKQKLWTGSVASYEESTSLHWALSKASGKISTATEKHKGLDKRWLTNWNWKVTRSGVSNIYPEDSQLSISSRGYVNYQVMNHEWTQISSQPKQSMLIDSFGLHLGFFIESVIGLDS